MDYFKIFTIIFMIFIAYKLCLIEAKSVEPFEGSQQSLGGVDDTNAINTLAQIAKNLMAGGVTVPGNMTVQGALNPAHSVWHSSTDGKHRIHYGNNSHSYYKTGDAHVWRNRDDADRMVLDHNANLRVDGGLTVQGVFNPAHSVWHTSTDGKHRIHYSNNSHSYYKTGDAHVWRNRDDQDRMVLDHGANLRVDGGLTVQGRNIIAELNDLRANCVRYDTQFKMSIPDDRGGAAGGGRLVGACGWACGGNASITGTNDANRQLGLMINRW
jgi:hypothetical protein